MTTGHQQTLWLLYLALVSLPFEALWSGISEPSYVVQGMPRPFWMTLLLCAPGVLGLLAVEDRQREAAVPSQYREYVRMIAVVAIFTVATGALVLSTTAAVLGVRVRQRSVGKDARVNQDDRVMNVLLGLLILMMTFNWGFFFVRHYCRGNLLIGIECSRETNLRR